MEEEYCIPWEPVPAEANRYMVLNIAYMAWACPHIAGPWTSSQLAMYVTSTLDPDDRRGQAKVLAWRILFKGVRAFRQSAAERWHGPMPTALPTDSLNVALWEVGNSRWLPECLNNQALAHQGVRHFVIANSFDFVDIAAWDWEVEAVEPWLELRERLRSHWRALFQDSSLASDDAP